MAKRTRGRPHAEITATENIVFRVTPELRELLEAKVQSDGGTISAFIRAAIQEKLTNSGGAADAYQRPQRKKFFYPYAHNPGGESGGREL
jgi:hypothetical protein